MFRFLLLAALVSVSYAYLPVRPLADIPAPIFPSAGRIVGGEVTTIEDVPYQVVMLFVGSLRCGGSIVKANVIVSAAHCTVGISASSISFRAGSSNHNSGGQVVPSSRIFNHESYSGSTIDYDICIVALNGKINLGASAAPIALPNQGLDVPGGSTAQTSGWGATSQGGSISAVIRKVVIPIVDQEVCSRAYGALGYRITPRMICAGLIQEGGKDACQGDSGGPLVVANTLVGVTSWGYGCARPGFPGVWARVPEMQDWVDDKLSQIESV